MPTRPSDSASATNHGAGSASANRICSRVGSSATSCQLSRVYRGASVNIAVATSPAAPGERVGEDDGNGRSETAGRHRRDRAARPGGPRPQQEAQAQEPEQAVRRLHRGRAGDHRAGNGGRHRSSAPSFIRALHREQQERQRELLGVDVLALVDDARPRDREDDARQHARGRRGVPVDQALQRNQPDGEPNKREQPQQHERMRQRAQQRPQLERQRALDVEQVAVGDQPVQPAVTDHQIHGQVQLLGLVDVGQAAKRSDDEPGDPGRRSHASTIAATGARPDGPCTAATLPRRRAR